MFPHFRLDTLITFMLIYESMHSLLVLYDYIGSYVIQNMVAKTGTKVAKTDTSTLSSENKCTMCSAHLTCLAIDAAVFLLSPVNNMTSNPILLRV